MQNLKTRLAKLEAVALPPKELTLIRRFVSPGQIDREMNRLHDGDGYEWTRQPGETEQELIDRASREVKRTPWGVAILTADDGEVCRADN